MHNISRLTSVYNPSEYSIHLNIIILCSRPKLEIASFTYYYYYFNSTLAFSSYTVATSYLYTYIFDIMCREILRFKIIDTHQEHHTVRRDGLGRCTLYCQTQKTTNWPGPVNLSRKKTTQPFRPQCNILFHFRHITVVHCCRCVFIYYYSVTVVIRLVCICGR